MRHFGWFSNTAYHLNKTFGVNFNHCVVTFYYFIRLCVVTLPHAYFKGTSRGNGNSGNFPDFKSLKKSFNLVAPLGSWTLQLRTLHLRMLYLRDFIFWQLNLQAVTPSEISPSGCYTFGMFDLRDVSPSGRYTFGKFTFGKLHLWTFHLRKSSETVEGVILRSCNVPKVKHLKV